MSQVVIIDRSGTHVSFLRFKASMIHVSKWPRFWRAIAWSAKFTRERQRERMQIFLAEKCSSHWAATAGASRFLGENAAFLRYH